MKWIVIFFSIVASATPGVLDLPAASVVGYGSDFKFLAIDAEKKGYQYAYAADILQTGSTKSMAFCSFPTLPGEIDVLHFYTSPDNGLSWVDAKADFHPNPEAERSACDPSRIKFGAYYYLYYSGLPVDIGSNIYVARSASPQGPWEKYIGNDRWSGAADAKPKSIMSSQRHIPVCGGGAVNDSPNDPNCANYSRYYGAGQQNAVVVGGQIYLFFVDDTEHFPKDQEYYPRRTIYLAKSADGVHFSAAQKSQILNTQDSFALHSPQILYSPNDAKFVALSVGLPSIITSGGHNDREARSSLVVATSVDGVKWTPLSQAVPAEHLPYFAHNLGVSRSLDGYLENVSLISMGAPFKPSSTNGAGTWGQWNLYMDFAQIKVASSQEPMGNFEEILNDQAKGWIVDMDYSSYAVELHVYVGGEYANGGTFYGSFTTDELRPDVNSYFGISGQHGFLIPLDEALKGQRVYIYAIDLNGNLNSLVGSVQY